jgi:hypothetical protein
MQRAQVQHQQQRSCCCLHLRRWLGRAFLPSGQLIPLDHLPNSTVTVPLLWVCGNITGSRRVLDVPVCEEIHRLKAQTVDLFAPSLDTYH